ncbi:MAG: recombinase family protein [Rhodospirillales bacterium]|jgi:DNA invertase Pin-like site-specific DNA recombinase
MLIGYMRVSTADQSLDLQRDALLAADVSPDRIYEDVCSGKSTERPGLARALDVARDGDAIVVWKLDRVGRSLPHVVGLVGDLQKRGVGLKVLTGDIDTTTPTGRLVFGIFATLAEFERDLIHERTIAGLAAARARGRAGGRPRVMTKQKVKAAMALMADRDNAARDVANQLGVSLSTLYAYVDAKGEPRERARELLVLKKLRPSTATA